jgi:hypothetical protein
MLFTCELVNRCIHTLLADKWFFLMMIMRITETCSEWICFTDRYVTKLIVDGFYFILYKQQRNVVNQTLRQSGGNLLPTNQCCFDNPPPSLSLSNIYIYIYIYMGGAGRSVGTAADYGLDGPGIESRWGRDFSHTPRTTLGPTQPPVQWVEGLSRGYSGRGVVLTTQPLLAPRSRKGRAIHPLGQFRPVTGVFYLYIYIYIVRLRVSLALSVDSHWCSV